MRDEPPAKRGITPRGIERQTHRTDGDTRTRQILTEQQRMLEAQARHQAEAEITAEPEARTKQAARAALRQRLARPSTRPHAMVYGVRQQADATRRLCSRARSLE